MASGNLNSCVRAVMEEEKARLRKMLTALAGIAATQGKRADAEMRYFMFCKKQGVKLRGKYRPS